MSLLTFGDVPGDVSEPEYFGLGGYFTGIGIEEEISATRIVIRDSISGAKLTVTGNFAVASLNDVLVTGTSILDPSGATLFDWSGFSLRFAQLAALDSEQGNRLILQGADEIRGSQHTDTLLAFAGDDLIRGYFGDDFIDGGTGADRMIGGFGDNTYVVDHAGDVVEEDLSVAPPLVRNLRRVSVGADGEQADGWSSGAEISGHGRFVVFGSRAGNLVEGDADAIEDIFIKDLSSGEVARFANPSRTGPASSVGRPFITGDGHFVTFDGQGEIFLANRVTGEVRSITSAPEAFPLLPSFRGMSATVTGDGSNVVFTAPLFTPEAQDSDGFSDVVILDLLSPRQPSPLTPGSLLVVSQGVLSEYSPAGMFLQSFVLKDDATTVADDLRDIAVDASGRVLIYVGAESPTLTVLDPAQGSVSIHSAPGWSMRNHGSFGGLDTAGSFAFATDAMPAWNSAIGLVRFDLEDFSSDRFGAKQYSDVTVGLDGLVYALVPGAIDVFDPVTLVLLRTVGLSGVGQRLAGIAVGADGTIYGASSDTSGTVVAINDQGAIVRSLDTGVYFLDAIDLRSDGKIVIGSNSGRVILTDTTLQHAAYLSVFGDASVVAYHSLPDPDVPFESHSTLREVSGPSGNGLGGESRDAEVTPDGRWVVFESRSSYLVSGDTNNRSDVFVKDLASGVMRRVSVSTAGIQANGDSQEGEITPDGRFVVFQSDATDLVPGFDTVSSRIYRKDLQTNEIQVASASPDASVRYLGAGNADISADGRFVVFHATRFDAQTLSILSAEHVFVRDMLTGELIVLSEAAPGNAFTGRGRDATISDDGKTIAFASDSANLVVGDTNGAGDIFVVSNPILVSGPPNVDTVRASVAYTLPEGIEQLVLTGVASLSGTGNELDNVMTGNAGANLLDGRAGNDTMAGGAGDDTYLVDSADDVVEEAVNQGNDRVLATASYTLSAHIERLELQGVANLNGAGNAQANVLVGNGGSNVLAGGGGDDQYTVGIGDTVVEVSGGGFDVVRSEVSFALPDHVEQLILTGNGAADIAGNTGDNALVGNGGNNALDGGRGGDSMAGGQGNDSYRVDNALDQITEAAAQGDDGVTAHVSYALATNLENLTLSQQAGNASGTGNAGNNVLEGNSRANVLDGGAGNDILRGLGGEDVLIGGAGDDRLSGGAGRDTLYGDAGADRFVFDSAINGVVNLDLIVDFLRGVDRIELSGAIFGGLGPVGALAADRFASGAGATALDALDRIVYDSATGMLYYDADGNGVQGMLAFAQVTPGLALTAGDFVVAA